MKSNLVLEQESEIALNNPQESDIEVALTKLHHHHHSFASIKQEDGSYVQVAGAPLRLTVEFRRVNQNAFQHFVCGRSSDDIKICSVNYSGGAITLQKNEVLQTIDAIAIFCSFMKTGLIPSEYVLRDVTAQFQS